MPKYYLRNDYLVAIVPNERKTNSKSFEQNQQHDKSPQGSEHRMTLLTNNAVGT